MNGWAGEREERRAASRDHCQIPVEVDASQNAKREQPCACPETGPAREPPESEWREPQWLWGRLCRLIVQGLKRSAHFFFPLPGRFARIFRTSSGLIAKIASTA
jgi:hypothetical protein